MILRVNYAFSKAKHINLVSKGFESYFVNRFKNANYSWFTNGIDKEFLLTEVPVKSELSESATITVLYAGNIGEGQGLNTIIPVLARLAGVKYKFKVIGDVGRKAALVEASKGITNISFHSPVNREQLIQEYLSADILFLHLKDKAVRPMNVMGATKRMAELALQGLAQEQGAKHNTRFCMVRFGNVPGSSCSVVPLFRRQIKEGGPITLTHLYITRFFMTIPEAAQLVIQVGAMRKGGEVFVLDMGDSVKIKDLATKMVRLSGFEVKSDTNPHSDIEIKCTGLRPGEKLFEELLIGDNVGETSHEQIMTANEVILPLAELNIFIEALDIGCHNFEHEKIRQLLLDAPTGFNPTDGICDLVWNTRLENDFEGNTENMNNVVNLSK